MLECAGRTDVERAHEHFMIDLRSDTVTKPTEAMRKAMARADVGDDVYGEDPTVNRLQDKAAAMFGKKAALFVPSGTMGNQLAIRLHTQPGQEVIVESTAHIVRYEQGAAGALAGVQLHWVVGNRGLISAEQVEAAVRPKDPHTIQTALICLENTHNSGGGTIYPLRRLNGFARWLPPMASRCIWTAHDYLTPSPPPPCHRPPMPNTLTPCQSVSPKDWGRQSVRC